MPRQFDLITFLLRLVGLSLGLAILWALFSIPPNSMNGFFGVIALFSCFGLGSGLIALSLGIKPFFN